jgi:hypothetical protein
VGCPLTEPRLWANVSSGDPMQRTSVIMHKGKSIVVIDLTDEQELEVSLASFDRAAELITKFPPKSARLVTIVTGARYSTEAAARMKSFSKEVTPYMKGSAAVGIDGMKAVLLRGLIAVTGRDIRIFPDAESAKDWLASL